MFLTSPNIYQSIQIILPGVESTPQGGKLAYTYKKIFGYYYLFYILFRFTHRSRLLIFNLKSLLCTSVTMQGVIKPNSYKVYNVYIHGLNVLQRGRVWEYKNLQKYFPIVYFLIRNQHRIFFRYSLLYRYT